MVSVTHAAHTGVKSCFLLPLPPPEPCGALPLLQCLGGREFEPEDKFGFLLASYQLPMADKAGSEPSVYDPSSSSPNMGNLNPFPAGT